MYLENWKHLLANMGNEELFKRHKARSYYADIEARRIPFAPETDRGGNHNRFRIDTHSTDTMFKNIHYISQNHKSASHSHPTQAPFHPPQPHKSPMESLLHEECTVRFTKIDPGECMTTQATCNMHRKTKSHNPASRLSFSLGHEFPRLYSIAETRILALISPSIQKLQFNPPTVSAKYESRAVRFEPAVNQREVQFADSRRASKTSLIGQYQRMTQVGKIFRDNQTTKEKTEKNKQRSESHCKRRRMVK